jgi:hypothetical protein
MRDAEQAMAKLQRQVDALQDELVATTDHTELARIGADLATAQAELATHEDRWLHLAEQQ